ncbi:hypothetical protein K8Q94_00075 [Candidatus Nomurabacteria bacterium]|nr:hypothetical protein [Candidatus Nomurabacteria bacterium]
MNKIAFVIIFACFVLGAFYFFELKKDEVLNPPSMSDEKILVAKYIRDNIKIIVPEKPVLGGAWYVVELSLDSTSKTGSMTYEDGHIQNKATFSYVLNNEVVLVRDFKKLR